MAGNDVVFACNDKNAAACAKLDTGAHDGKVTVKELLGSKTALFKATMLELDPASQGRTLLKLAGENDGKFAEAFNALYPLRTPFKEKPAHLDKVAQALVAAISEFQDEK